MNNDDFDFGFTTVSEDEINKVAETFKVSADTYQQKYAAVLSLFKPLLNNLLKDADTQPYIYWPNRSAKIAEVLRRLDTIDKSK